jgi:hypothetical protein
VHIMVAPMQTCIGISHLPSNSWQHFSKRRSQVNPKGR